ncbi:MAG TPA: hypothetical protein VKT32_05055 [Chthonomonadaceae bacterium]|nr:hypothetical protein [Chthonomonadaceae bacterium]
MQPITLRWIARILILAWACWWTFFAVASTLFEGPDSIYVTGGWHKALLPCGLAALVFLGSALLAWRWEAAGAVLLIAEGLLVCLAYYPIGFLHGSLNTILFVLLTLATPPIVAGLLFFLSWRGMRAPHPA